MSYGDFVINHDTFAWYTHGTAQFYPYHRMLVWMFEQALQSTGYSGAQPYIDWSTHSSVCILFYFLF
jgi:tyrosinase